MAFYYDLDSTKIDIELIQENPFKLKINSKINSQLLYISPKSIFDGSKNYFTDSLTTLSIASKINKQPNNIISFGQLSGKINNFDSEVMVEAKNIDSGNVHYTKSKDNEFLFNELEPGKYSLRAFEILNSKDESIYFSGKVAPYSRAAKFALYPEEVDIRARWEIEGININFNEK